MDQKLVSRETLPSPRSGEEVLPGYPRYRVQGGRIEEARTGKEGEVSYVPLANFACRIRREVRRTDGVQAELLFELEGHTPAGPLPQVRVRAAEFAAMHWPVREWGARAIVTPGMGVRDRLRAAIQHLSDPERATVYAHTGWIERDGEWVYLHAGGGIGPRGSVGGLEVDLPPELAGFALPHPPTGEEEREAGRRLLGFLEVAPRRVTWPLLLYAMGAPINHPMGSLYLSGLTGARKTSLALLLQALWGHTAPHPPVNWEATANALEALAFTAKDALLLVDDYAPTGHEGKQKELQARAARLLRNQGNASGRARMRPDGGLQPDRAPRGSLIITGEDLPPGHSVRARCLILELERGEVDLQALSRLQGEMEGLSAGLAAWVCWLAGRLEGVRQGVRLRSAELRERYPGPHGRTTDALARLYAVWEALRTYWLEAGVLDEAEAVGLSLEVEAALRAVGEAQGGYQRDTDPVERFLPLLMAALSSGRAHLGNRHNAAEPPTEPERWGWQARADGWVPQGARVGWVDEQGVYLEPAAAYAALNRLAAEIGEPLPTPRTLWKRLGERGLIRSQERGGRVRYGVAVRIGGVPRDVIQISGGILAKTPNSPYEGESAVQHEGKGVGRKSAVGSSVSPYAPEEGGGWGVEL
ncbi:hypothetical protein DNA98_07210 [Meiothermus sp. Pnk-1]|nr:hypothetical protein DNA98_07210 [Meiothermus sp. Pnk-1]